MKHLLLCLSLVLLSACQTTQNSKSIQSVPTSERLEEIRSARSYALSKEMQHAGLQLGAPIFIRIFKQSQMLETWVKPNDQDEYIPFKKYPICTYSGQLGPKLHEGDFQAPEGFYMVAAEQMNPNSQFHLSFDLGFPNAFDQSHKRTGSLLMVHGGCKSWGCFAITDDAIEEVYLMVEASIYNGADVPVHIFPFEMTNANLEIHRALGWGLFWQNLKQGYDIFETSHIPPKVDHNRYRYVFTEPPTQIEKLKSLLKNTNFP